MKRFLTATLLGAGLIAAAAVQLPSIFSDHAVLLRSKDTAIFGYASPGEKVNVSINGIKGSAVTGKNGKWLVRLDLSKCPEGPFILNVNDKKIKDVLIGEVWLCSGQSNMEFRLRNCDNYDIEKKQFAGSRLRTFKLPHRLSKVPLKDAVGTWSVASGRDAAAFTGVGYFFGKKLLTTLNTPVGLINSSWGGTPIEPWMSKEDAAVSPETIKRNLEQKKILREFPDRLKEAVQAFQKWEEKFSRTDTTARTLPPADAKSQTVKFSSLKPLYGAVWFSTTIDIHKKRAGIRMSYMIYQPAPAELYFNGQLIAKSTAADMFSRNHFIGVIPGKYVKPGKNLIQLRLFGSGFPADRNLKHRVIFGPYTLNSKPWQMFVERALPAPSKAALAEMPKMPEKTYEVRLISRTYNAMILPLAPYSLSGIIWYQGEANASRAEYYKKLFPAMITAWRKLFEKPALPFYFCQLAPYYGKTADPGMRSTWAELREAQTEALALKATGQANLLDVGEARDIHPRNKIVPAERMAAMALNDVYGIKSDCRSPIFRKAVKEGNSVRIFFDHAEKGLQAKKLPETYFIKSINNTTAKLVRNSPDSPVEGFAVKDSSGKWHWANAKICKDSVLVSAPGVKEIKTVRYAWANNPTCNLYGKNDLPVTPFQINL